MGIFFFYQFLIVGNIIYWRFYNPSTTSFISIKYLKEKSSEKILNKWVDYERIADDLKKAVISSEDSKFLYHRGFDWIAIKESAKKNFMAGKIITGGSTITQQLSKNLFLTGKKTIFRKIQEAIITINIEFFLDKKRILEIYLNVIEWGDGVYGVEAAAKTYFSKIPSDLTKNESAILAALIPNPIFYQKKINSITMKNKTSIILTRMHLAKIP